MSSIISGKISFSIFGESHGEAIGVVIDGLPSGLVLDMEKINFDMQRRAPGFDNTSTPRKEADIPKIISGVIDNTTTGAPLCCIIENTNKRSTDYSSFSKIPRPSHSDYAAFIKYNGFNDIRGGGHFSGRLTATLVFAGAICKQILSSKGVYIGAHIYSIFDVYDTPFDMVGISKEQLFDLNAKRFAVIDSSKEQPMRYCILKAKNDGDSVGGIVECAVVGVKAGIGSPMFGGVENIISSVLFGVPAVKGVEFGGGFSLTNMYGSQANDEFDIINGKIVTNTNNSGGILGGITNSMPIIVRAAIKPTPSISKLQNSVDIDTKTSVPLQIAGRHDPCIVPRAVSVIEAATAIAILNLYCEEL